MTKDEYFKISETKGLPPRCPCLSTCSRYRYTAYFVGQTSLNVNTGDTEKDMKRMGILSDSEHLKNMLDAGEPITYSGGSRNFFINNACPEFFLHDHQHKCIGMGNVATHQFSYDELYRGKKFKPGESRHYTECPEYSLFILKKPKGRIKIPSQTKVRAELQKEIGSKCPFCENEDVGHFQIHHIDENRDNNKITNLLLLCPICHSKITKRDISFEDVQKRKVELISQSPADI